MPLALNSRDKKKQFFIGDRLSKDEDLDVYYSSPGTRTLLNINDGEMHYMRKESIPVVVKHHSF
jgi:hypothetical protein